MSAKRIPTKAPELRDVLLIAAAAIGNEASWPPSGPTQGDVSTEANDLHAAITAVEVAEAALKNLRGELNDKREAARATMKRIDQITDGLYTPEGLQKNNFGLAPKKTSPGYSVPLVQPIILKIRDGIAPSSIFVDWDSQEGAAGYNIEWHLNSTMTGTPIGTVGISESEYEITGLQPKQQYWIRVRANRGHEFSQWSDPATRTTQ